MNKASLPQAHVRDTRRQQDRGVPGGKKAKQKFSVILSPSRAHTHKSKPPSRRALVIQWARRHRQAWGKPGLVPRSQPAQVLNYALDTPLKVMVSALGCTQPRAEMAPCQMRKEKKCRILQISV